MNPFRAPEMHATEASRIPDWSSPKYTDYGAPPEVPDFTDPRYTDYGAMGAAPLTESEITRNGEAYLCVADLATGFAYDQAKKRWRQATFSVDGKKYMVVRRSHDEVATDHAWSVKEIGTNFVSFICKDEFSERGDLHCIGLGEGLLMSKRTLRFLSYKTLGYWQWPLSQHDPEFTTPLIGGSPVPENAETPYIMIGKCSALELPAK